MLIRTVSDDPAVAMDRLRLRLGAGLPPEDLARLPARSQRALAVALAVGAPLSDAIDGAQAAEDDAARGRRAVAVASAQTRVVAGGLLLAPAVLVPALGRLVGADLVGFYTSGLGVAVLAAGATLLAVGGALVIALVRRVGRAPVPTTLGTRAALPVAIVVGVATWWTVGPILAPLTAMLAHHLVERRSSPTPVGGIDEAADLAATALAGGVSAAEALRFAAEQLPGVSQRLGRLAFGLELGMTARDLRPEPPSGAGGYDDGSGGGRVARPRAVGTHDPGSGRGRARPRMSRRASGRAGGSDGLHRLVVVLTTADEVGAPIAPTLRRLAHDLRADELARVLAAAERLPAQLTFPTALCLLPATVLLVGAPIVHAGLSAAGI